VGRGVSASCIAVLSAAALLAGCGGGAPNKASSGTTGARSSSSAASSAPSRTTPPPGVATAPPDAYWPYAKLIARLAGRTVAVSNAAVRLDPALMECNGEGAARRAGSTREWTIFEGGADHDITFDVVISSATQMTISSPRTGPD
jgi:hypothetical protein